LNKHNSPEVNETASSTIDEEAVFLEHYPVMLPEVLEGLNIRPGLTYVDATAGAGGHLRAILKKLDGRGRVIGIDQDKDSLDKLALELPEQVTLIHDNFSNLKNLLAQKEITTIDGGILADLGVSSMQIDQGARGFSFQKDGPLDMRMNQAQSLSAWEIVNNWPEDKIADIIFKYGEERYGRRIARNICNARPINNTLELANIVARSVPWKNDKNKKKLHKKNSGGADGAGKFRNFPSIHPATRTFQALRMAVNLELESLENFLEDALKLLSPGARLVLITFHSLEDRMVKQFFKAAANACICPPRAPMCTCNKRSELLIINRKPITAAEKELLANNRSRSAKLRAGEKLN
jgi:16S rRNA (cytosine1402-N4)-methyltransferase